MITGGHPSARGTDMLSVRQPLRNFCSTYTRLTKTNQYRLQGMRVNTLELRAHFLDGGQLGLLLQPSNTLPCRLIRLNPFLQSGIVQLPAQVYLRRESLP